MKVLLKRFCLNGHTIGFHPQTQKLKTHTCNKASSFSLGLKGLKIRFLAWTKTSSLKWQERLILTTGVAYGRNPFYQNFRKFQSKTQWIGSVQLEKFRKNRSTFWGGPLLPVRLVRILVEWIMPYKDTSSWLNSDSQSQLYVVY